MNNKADLNKDGEEKAIKNPHIMEDGPAEEAPQAIEEKPSEPQKNISFFPIFKTFLTLALIACLSWAIYYLHGIIQNNLKVNIQLEQSMQKIDRIQSEQVQIKEAINSFNDSDKNADEFTRAADKLNKEILVLKKEIIALQKEIKNISVEFSTAVNRNAGLPAREKQTIQPEAVKIPAIPAIPKGKEGPEVKEEKVEQKKDGRNKVIKFIEESVKTAVEKTKSFFN